MEQQVNKKLVLQWHPAFFAELQIEFGEEVKKMLLESEHQLGTRPKEIDVLIIKKNSEEPIEKNIGRIFRKHNIVEYKSPADYLSVDDYYKVHAYACFYKVDTAEEDSIKAEEITISFVTKRYPRNLIRHLREVRSCEVVWQEEGIYYVFGDFFPMQIIVTSQLSKEKNFWLRNLTDDIRDSAVLQEITTEYQKNRTSPLHRSVMNAIVRANREQFKEDENIMCEAIIELFQEEYDAGIKAAREDAMKQGMKQGKCSNLAELVSDGLLAMDEAVKRSNLSEEEFRKLL